MVAEIIYLLVCIRKNLLTVLSFWTKTPQIWQKNSRLQYLPIKNLYQIFFQNITQ